MFDPSTSIEKTGEQLKEAFVELGNVRNDVLVHLETLKTKIEKLKEIYESFVKENSQYNAFVFGLDSLKYQGRLLDIEYDDMWRIYLSINNRMYCEYYKLYQIIVTYIEKELQIDSSAAGIVFHAYPVYKDLEPYKQYDNEILKELHAAILLLILGIHRHIGAKELALRSHRKKNTSGLNIDNFVHAFQYNLYTVREKMQLFLSYLDFFHRLHAKYWKRFSNKVQLLFSQVSNDIHFDDELHQPSSTQKKALMRAVLEEQHNSMDRALIQDLKNSIHTKSMLRSVDSMDSFPLSLNLATATPSPKSEDDCPNLTTIYSRDDGDRSELLDLVEHMVNTVIERSHETDTK